LKNISKIRKLKKAVGEEGWSVLKNMFLPVKTEFENPRPDFSYVPQSVEALLNLMIRFCDALEDEKNQSHGAVILRHAIDENKLLKVEAIMLCTFILFAGYETSVSLLSNSVYHLCSDSEVFIELKNNTNTIESFIEESLRFYTPVGRFLRRANEDVIIGGQTIPEGSMVIAMLGAANVDSDRFQNPYSFQADREKNQHMSFGKGIHFCVGAPLARLQAKLALTALVKSASHLSLDNSKELRMVTDRDNGILRLEELWVQIG
jgi:cytochrome P450